MIKLYQIGIPIDSLSNVLLNYTCFEPHEKIVITPSSKDENLVVIETRHTELAAAIISDVKEAKVKIVDIPVKIVKL